MSYGKLEYDDENGFGETADGCANIEGLLEFPNDMVKALDTSRSLLGLSVDKLAVTVDNGQFSYLMLAGRSGKTNMSRYVSDDITRTYLIVSFSILSAIRS